MAVHSVASKSATSNHTPCARQAGVLVLLLILLLSACSTQPGIYHTVTQGQTLYRISRAYGVDERYLARINRIEDPTQLRVGQRLFIPGASRLKTIAEPLPIVTQTPAATTAARPVTAPQTGKPPVPPQTAARSPVKTPPPDTRATAPASPAQQTPLTKPTRPSGGGLADNYQGRFVWPLRGEIVRRFGDAGNPPCKGLEISAKRGTPVLSAAPGHVIYSGDGIRSYGNLVILRHDDDFFTVYGYNDSNLVKAGNFVSKGDRIALSGVSPGGGAPRLYFEIRRGKDAVNPIFYLP